MSYCPSCTAALADALADRLDALELADKAAAVADIDTDSARCGDVFRAYCPYQVLLTCDLHAGHDGPHTDLGDDLPAPLSWPQSGHADALEVVAEP